MIIDFHTHVFSPEIKKNRDKYLAKDPCFAQLYSNPKAKLVTAEELVAAMDRAEIDISVILNLGWTTHELCADSNDYILESAARYPKRLIGFCAIQPRSPEAALNEIERCAKSGAKGIGELRPDMQMFDLRDETLMAPLVETITKFNMILLTHSSEPVGHIYPGKGEVTPTMLYPFIIRFPELKLVCAHWGGGLPFYALMPEVKKVLANVYFDTAASPFLYSPEIYRQVAQIIGADKILFGSDYPLLSPGRLMEEIKTLNLPEETKSLIFAENVRKLMNLK